MIFFIRHPNRTPQSPASAREPHEFHGSIAPPMAQAKAVPLNSGAVIWLGPGLYFRQQDGVLRIECALLGGGWDRLYRWKDRADIPKGLVVLDAQKRIEAELAALGLPIATAYMGLTRQECTAIAALADRFHLAWGWMAWRKKRFLMLPAVERCVMTVQFLPDRREYYRS